MAKNGIRLRYPGFVVFITNLLSIVTGIAFALMITRNVSTKEFGIWGNVGDIYGYFAMFAGVFPFWTTRFIARRHAGAAKTGLIANILVSIASASLYLALIPILLPMLQISNAYMLLYALVAIQIIEFHTLIGLGAIIYAKKPQSAGYGIFIYEVCKVVLGFALIMQLELGLLGAIYSMLISWFIQIVFYVKLTARELKENVRWKYVKEWLKASPINVYDMVGKRIGAFAYIFLFVYGGELARAYQGAAATIAAFIGYSSALAYALYPRLLTETKAEDVSVSIKMVLTFAIPMMVGVIVLSESYLTILNQAYAIAKPVLIVLALGALLGTLSQVFNSVVVGTEKVDATAKIPLKQLVRSNLFKIYTLTYVLTAVSLPTTLLLIYIAKTPLEAATYFVILGPLFGLAGLLYTYIIARKCLPFTFPWKNTAKYVIASAVMATILLIIPHPRRLSPTVGLTLLGGTVYFITLASIDEETRSLAKSILQEISRIVSRAQSIF